MADNVAITAGSGTSVATDDVSGAHYQRVKLADGTADSSTAIVAGNGAASGALRVTLANDSTGVVQPIPATSGGLSTYHLISAGSTNATVVKASAGQLYGWSITNTTTAWSYVKLHNASTTPTAGASVFFTVGVPPNGGTNFSDELGVAFSTGIALTTVTGVADSNSTAVAASDLNINLFYK